jgi:hypothetical protein
MCMAQACCCNISLVRGRSHHHFIAVAISSYLESLIMIHLGFSHSSVEIQVLG